MIYAIQVSNGIWVKIQVICADAPDKAALEQADSRMSYSYVYEVDSKNIETARHISLETDWCGNRTLHLFISRLIGCCNGA